jgi:hypothetical protein
MTTVGYFMGAYVAVTLGHFLLGFLMLPVGVGAGVGLMQRPVLRRLVPQSGELMWAGWVLASMVGLAASFTLSGLVASAILNIERPFEWSWPVAILWAVTLLVGGGLIGTLQHLMLRRHTGRSVWWIPASAAGWGLSVTGLAVASAISLYPVLEILLAPAVAGAVLGIVTGRAAIWICR